jgi:hypothetical protein
MIPVYTDDQIATAVRQSDSVLGVMRYLGYPNLKSGSSLMHLKKRIIKLGLDISHFRVGGRRGRRGVGKQSADEILVLRTDRREHTYKIRRAMIEVGIPYCCNQCGLDPLWRNQPLRLEIDHKNDNPLDNRVDNLEFVCPNCHSQKPVVYRKR